MCRHAESCLCVVVWLSQKRQIERKHISNWFTENGRDDEFPDLWVRIDKLAQRKKKENSISRTSTKAKRIPKNAGLPQFDSKGKATQPWKGISSDPLIREGFGPFKYVVNLHQSERGVACVYITLNPRGPFVGEESSECHRVLRASCYHPHLHFHAPEHTSLWGGKKKESGQGNVCVVFASGSWDFFVRSRSLLDRFHYYVLGKIHGLGLELLTALGKTYLTGSFKFLDHIRIVSTPPK